MTKLKKLKCVINDKNLSLKEIGLYCLLMTLPEDFNFSITNIAKLTKEGKNAINRAVINLEKQGHLTRTRIRKKNLFSHSKYNF